MHSAEIVESEPARHRCPVVLPLFAKSIRQAREAAKAHARAQITSLDYRGADSFGIGLPVNWDHLYGLDFGGRVSRFAFLRCPVHLDELCEASQPVMQSVCHSSTIRRGN